MKRNRGQGEREDQEAEACRREEEEEIGGVSSTTLGQGTSRGCCPFGEH